MKRVIFYFDGFNFYNGLKDKSEIEPQWKNYYWLDFIKFSNLFLSHTHQLISVNYFTSPPSNDTKRSRQSALFSANKLINPGLFNVINGQYQDREILCKKCNKKFYHPEEKRTDVSIAIQMVSDCFLARVDLLILVTADSDQIPAIQLIRSQFPKIEVRVYFPPERNSAEILGICKPIVFLGDNEDKFKTSLLPAIVTSGSKKYTKPHEWKG